MEELIPANCPEINDLVNTKLKARVGYDKSYMHGEAWNTLKPHFYPTDSLDLDAKQMGITQVSLVKGNALIALEYHYDGWSLKIKLDKIYSSSEKYTIHIKYTAKPNEAKLPAGEKGLYFINPKENRKICPHRFGLTEKQTILQSGAPPLISQTRKRPKKSS